VEAIKMTVQIGEVRAKRVQIGEVRAKRMNSLYAEKVWEGNDITPLNFGVVEYPIISNGQTVPDRKTIFREDGIYLATVSANYPIHRHSEIVSRIEEGMNFKNTSIKTILSKDGSKMIRSYTLHDFAVEVRQGDSISPMIRIVNSYDGSTAIGFFIDALRLVCTNGMIATRQFMSMSYKHFGKRFNLNTFAENAKRLTKGFESYSKNWQKWVNDPVDDDRALTIIKFAPARLQALIISRLDENFDNTKWGLYNAFTAVLSHDYVPSRAASPDTQKIKLGAEITKMFADSWYWKTPVNELNQYLNMAKAKKKEIDADVIDVEAVSSK